MKVIFQPGQLQGKIFAPASKSAMQRACAAALIHKGKTVLTNPGFSADDRAAMGIIKQLGAKVHLQNDIVEIESLGVHPESTSINCGESGLSVRMFTSIASLSQHEISITGSGSLTRRPLHFFNEVLPKLGVTCETVNGHLPMKIKGPLLPADITIDGSLSSQYLTGLLFAFGSACASDVTIEVDNLNSKPYIDLTLQIMQHFGIKTPVNNSYQSFYFNSNIFQPQQETIYYEVEGDWSGGAFLLVAGALAGPLTVKGLSLSSAQADKAIMMALEKAGVQMSIDHQGIHITPGPLKAFQFNAVDCPDLFPPLVALAASCEGISSIEGVHRLTHKESNRAMSLQEEFKKMGIGISFQDDHMLVSGGKIKGGLFHSHEDHRIAMAVAVASLGGSEIIEVEGAEAVNKSYPSFWKDMETTGAIISTIEQIV